MADDEFPLFPSHLSDRWQDVPFRPPTLQSRDGVFGQPFLNSSLKTPSVASETPKSPLNQSFRRRGKRSFGGGINVDERDEKKQEVKLDAGMGMDIDMGATGMPPILRIFVLVGFVVIVVPAVAVIWLVSDPASRTKYMAMLEGIVRKCKGWRKGGLWHALEDVVGRWVKSMNKAEEEGDNKQEEGEDLMSEGVLAKTPTLCQQIGEASWRIVPWTDKKADVGDVGGGGRWRLRGQLNDTNRRSIGVMLAIKIVCIVLVFWRFLMRPGSSKSNTSTRQGLQSASSTWSLLSLLKKLIGIVLVFGAVIAWALYGDKHSGSNVSLMKSGRAIKRRSTLLREEVGVVDKLSRAGRMALEDGYRLCENYHRQVKRLTG